MHHPLRLPSIVCAAASASLFASPALADGKAFPRAEYAKVEMADQRAILHYDEESKVETLVIDTRIAPVGQASGDPAQKSEYAWVVPLPAVPTRVEPTSRGMFDTAQALAEPDMVTRKSEWTLLAMTAFLAAIVVGAVILVRRRLMKVAVGVGLTFCFLMLFIPVLGTSRKRGSGPTGDSAVTIHRHETIGAYDTAVLTGDDGTAVGAWLAKNGYAMPAETAPVVAQLAKDGWCFVAMRLHESVGAGAHPHPMAFVFPAAHAVYPMRLTGVGQTSPLTVDLFACGKREATAEGFQSRCAVPVVTAAHLTEHREEMGWSSRQVAGTDPVAWAHPGLRKLAPGTGAMTWLRAEIPPQAMGHDIALSWKPLTPHRDRFYSASAANERGAMAALFMLAAWVLVCAILLRLKRKKAAMWTGLGGLVIIGLLGVTVRQALPVAEVRENNGKTSLFRSMDASVFMGVCLCLDEAATSRRTAGKPVTAEWIRATLRSPEAQKDYFGNWITENWSHLFVEGDSPGNYALREGADDGAAKVFYYDGVGQEYQVWPDLPSHTK